MQTIDGVSKYCPKCKTIKDVADFNADNAQGDKLGCWCRKCNNCTNRERYANSEEVREQTRARAVQRLSDPVKHAEQLELQRQWHREHWQDKDYRENERARFKVYDASPAGKERAKRNRATERSHEYHRVYHRTYLKEKYNNDPEYRAKVRAWFAVRNNKKRTNGGTLTLDDWMFLVDLAQRKCLKCGQETKLTIDHIIPVTAGGATNVWNVQPLCFPCNSSKQTKVIDFRPDEYRQSVRGYTYSEVT
jgi:5-methylcytosine-specific restriction endonuclease McrA